ncbi:hypothetical protein KP509_23G086900 [Ceratopteris richardii]|nr:hypothetical protein KP509_23G086900 [Ceratopteris richardii]
MNQLDQHNRTDVNTSDDSHRVDVCGQATPGKVLEVDDQNPEKRLSATSLASAHTEVRADESTSRSKNVDIRVTRSSSSDAKACESASKHMQREQESDTDMALELQIMKGASSFKESMHQDTGSSHGEGIQETHFGAIMKQEQHLSTDINKSVHAAAIIKLTLPSHVQCHQNSSDCKNKSFIDTNVLQLGQQVKEQDLISHEEVIPHLPPKDLGHSYWFVSSVASGDPAPSIASGICSPPLRLAVHEQAMNGENSVHSLLSLSVNADGEVGTSHKNVEDYPSTLSCESSMFDLAFLGPEAYRKTLVTPLSEASRETPGLNTSETASECEVRLFGQSLKAPVAKVSLDTQRQVNRLDASINNTKPNLPRSKLVSDQETSLISSCSMVLEPDLDPSNHILGNLVSKCNVAVVGSCEKGEDIPITAPNNVSVVVAESIANVVNEVQTIRPESPKEPPESMHSISFDNVLPDPSPVSAVRVVEQETMLVNKMIEKSSDEQAHIPLSEITAPRLASYRKDTVLTEVSVDMVEQVSNLNVTANQGATKVLSAREDQAEAVVEQEGRPEISAEKSNSYVSSKKVSLFQQGISQKTPGRAGPNTWHRATGNLNVRQVSSKPVVDKQPPKVVSQKVSEGAAYVRKGNSLVRAPVSSIVASSQSLHLGCSIGKDLAGMGSTILSKATQGYPGFRNVVRNTARSAFRQTFSIHNAAAQEMIAKVGSNYKPTATMLAQEVSHDRQLLGTRPAMLVTPEGHSSISSVAKTVVAEETTPPLVASEVARDEPAVTAQTKSMPLSGQSVTVASKMPDSGTRLYVKSKANQLIAALPMKVSQSTPCNVNTSSQDAYYKRNKNQLVRNVSEANRNGVENPVTGKKAQEVFPLLFEKEFRKRAYLPSSKVWTLKEGSSSQVKSVLPLLFPWKRPSIGLTTYVRRYKALPKAKKGSLLFLISKKLQRLRKVQPVYSRSAGGFSLHRSGLFSLNGANLKWTKSIEKRSKKASKEATMAVAAVEKQKRKEKAAVEGTGGVAKSKVQRRLARQGSHGRGRVVTIGLARYKMDSSGRTLQRLPDQWCANAKSTESAILSTPRRLSYDGTEYVRIGNGHKLVRDPKAAARALASEKVRWSIHTARSRWAKKQQYCLFFTRFGKCNKSERDCPYIHDPEKIAVCRKFLKGTCSETICLFSHKVIPERMPDCSFFLEGMCTNEECPYRHVNVNPKAPICDGFLKGFCSEGDECNKKHTTVCPTFLATGECADRAACKLHHPRKKHKRPPNNHLWKVKNKKRRYFVMEENMYSGQQSDEQCLQDTSPAIADRNTEFIEVPDVIIDSEENGEFHRMFAPFKAHIQLPQDSLQGNTDLLIKPVMLLQRPVSC